MDAARKVKQAITNLVLEQPFFGTLALRLIAQSSEQIGTATTDGKVLLYNPSFIDSLNVGQVTGLVAHEVMHIASGHPWRRGGRDHSYWNKACDYAINGILKEAEFYLPSDALLDQAYNGQSAEAIFEKIRQQPKPPPDNPSGGAGQQSGGQDQQDQSQSDQDQDGDDNQDNQGDQDQDQDQDGDGDQDGQQDQGSGWGDVVDNLEADSQAQESDWQVAALQAAAMAKQQGKLPASLDRLIESIKKPAIDWRSALRRFVQQGAKADYTWKMPSARYLAGGLYLPSLRSEQMRRIALAVDTSGSIGQTELDRFGAEIQAIMDECQPEGLTVIYCDAQVNAVEEYEPLDTVKLKAVGGGGTDFAPVFKHIEEQGIDLACLVFFTDGYGSYPQDPPDYPVLWVMTSSLTAPFGETLTFPRE